MLKITTFKPIDAVHGVHKLLDDLLQDFDDLGSPMKMKLKYGRDLAERLVQHNDRYDVPDEVAMEMNDKLELVESI